MDMGMMGGGTDYAPLYAQAKEILAAGMLAELKEDAEEAMGQGEDQGMGGMGHDACPHCGAPMGAAVPSLGLGAPAPAEPPMPAMPDLSQFAMRVPPMGGAGAPPMRPLPMAGPMGAPAGGLPMRPLPMPPMGGR